MQAKTNHTNPRGRTRAEVLAARATPYGCCERHADNSACDCLAEAELAEFYAPAGYGWTEAAYETREAVRAFCDDEPCPCYYCHGRGQVYVGSGCDAEDDPACPECGGTGRAAP